MPILSFTFPDTINVSAQPGDIAYYVPTTSSSTFQVNSNDIIEIGVIIPPVLSQSFSCNSSLPSNKFPTSSDYIFFAKDNKVNQSNTLGYYARVDIKNNSKEKAEIFSISADYFESSK